MSRYNQKYQPFYQSQQWKELRRTVMMDNNYLCSECKNKGIIKQARAVHHKIPIEVDYSKRLEYENLECLCAECHNFKHSRCSSLQLFLEEWED